MSENFDRIRPPQDRLAARGDGGGPAEAATGAAGQGRQALFSAGPRRQGTAAVGVRCSRCGAATGLDARTAVRAAWPLVLVAPWRREPVFARCPACRRRSWLAVEVGA